MTRKDKKIALLFAVTAVLLGSVMADMTSAKAAAVAEPDQITVSAAEVTEKTPMTGRVTIDTLEITARHQATLTWQALEGADFYRVYRSQTKKGGYQRIKTTRKLTVSDTIEAGIEYFYKIIPYQYGADQSKIKGKVSAVRSIAEPKNVPVLEKITNTKNNTLTLSWSPMEDVSSYRIYRSYYADRDFVQIGETGQETHTFTDATVQPGTKYYYAISAIEAGSPSAESDKSSPLAVYTVSQAPSDLTLTQNDKSQVILKWSKTKGTGSYRIYRATSENGPYEKIADKIKTDTYTDTNVTVGQRYYYRLAAVHGRLISKKSAAQMIRVGNIWFSSKTLFVGMGEAGKVQLTATSNLDGEIIFTSADPDIATVTADGWVTGVSYGKTQILAEVDGVKAAADVSVTNATINGIDVSKWQADINWAKVKASGIRFAILRAKYATTTDTRFEEYYTKASNEGIDLGVYCYSTATSVAAAKKEARALVKLLDGRQLKYPVALDMEDQKQINNLTKEQRMDVILAYRDIIEDAGYQYVLYTNLNWLNHYLDQSVLGDEEIDIWIARYRDQNLGHCYTGKGNVCMWQYSSSGNIDGIVDAKGKYIKVDMDVCYEDFGD